MKITIIGWYGTETIGDRAILAGLLSFFSMSFKSFEIKLGSLYSFFTERTINEDYAFYKEIIKKDIKIDIFNSKKSKELVKAIKESNLVVMGGGPLMDLDELFMVEYTFKKAKKLGIKTALLGCGVGPLFHKKYKKSVLKIVLNSDLVILRDAKSKENLEEIFNDFSIFFDTKLIYTSYDPAVECALEFNKIYKKNEEDYIAINLREFPHGYSKNENLKKEIDDGLKYFVGDLSDKFSKKEILLIPMHYFHIGGDDRIFLNRIALELNKKNIYVQNPNLTLKETMQLYSNAYFNIGMRFHAVVLQTLVNGNNYILDYTEPNKGKIFGFINDIDKVGFYKNRYLSLQKDKIKSEIIKYENTKFEFDIDEIKKKLEIYIVKLKEV